MAINLPYYTSNDLIEAVKRKISFPISQETFSENDILKFANEEMFISQVPSVLMFHEEYFVMPVEVPLVSNQSRYQIPERAIGMRLRDVKYKDNSPQQNLFEMTRINPEEKAFFQGYIGANTSIAKYYLEGNEIVLVPEITQQTVGSLMFYIFLRPNQLVANDQAATCTAQSFASSNIYKNYLSNSSFIQVSPTNTVTISSHGFVAGNKLYFNSTDEVPDGLTAGALYYVVNPTTNDFQVSETIGGSAVTITSVGSGLGTIDRIKYLTNDINPEDVNFVTDTLSITNNDYANNDRVLFSPQSGGGSLPTPLLENTFYYIVGRTINTVQVSSTLGGSAVDITYVGNGCTITSDVATLTFDQVPDVIVGGVEIDFLQTGSGHKTFDYDIPVPTNGISSNTISLLSDNVPDAFEIGDYVCLANECIIPQIPSDLHNGLAERVCARILAAIGDQTGLQMSQAKIAEIDDRQGSLLDNRDEGNAIKIVNRSGLLRSNRYWGRGNW